MLITVVFFLGCQNKVAPVGTESTEMNIYQSGFDKYHSKDYKGAIEDFNKAIETKTNTADAYYWRAVTKYSMNDIEGSCKDYEKAHKMGHKDARLMLDKYCK